MLSARDQRILDEIERDLLARRPRKQWQDWYPGRAEVALSFPTWLLWLVVGVGDVSAVAGASSEKVGLLLPFGVGLLLFGTALLSYNRPAAGRSG